MPGINQFQDDVIDIKKQSLYARLKRLFSTDVIVRNVGGKQIKIKDTDNIMYATDRNSLRDRFNRIRATSYNAYSRDFALSYQAARMDLFRDYDCVGPDTIIPLPDGTNPTIAELAEKYKDHPEERFYVFSYDQETDSIKLGKAYHPRKKGHRMDGYKITFDDGTFLIGSDKHPVLMRNGEYKIIKNLMVGDSVMPFYQHTNKLKYRSIFNYSHGWVSEHKLIAEQFYGKINEDSCVHHRNFIHSDNSPGNLEIMTKVDHKEFHDNHNRTVLWGPENYEKQLKKMLSHPNYINRNFHHWDGKRKGKNNPFYAKTHSYESNEKRSDTLKEVFKNRNQTGEKNPKYRSDLTPEVLQFKAADYYKQNEKLDIFGLSKFVGCDYSAIKNRIPDWKEFKNNIVSTLNHKITSIEKIGEIDVYDITVEKYQNFATDSIICHNTMDMDPILAAALDIYADECVHADTIIPLLNGEKVKIGDLYSQNRTDFWVYSLDDLGNFVPKKCERVAYNGKKRMYKVTLDDGTEVKCTSEHQWVKSDGTIITTSELSTGTSLKVCKTKLSTSKFMPGYEMLYDGGKWKYTHRIVANQIPSLIKQRDTISPKSRIIHHSSFSKRNNEPEQLEWMHWKEHKALHSQHNKDIWSDPNAAKEYKEKIREAHRRYWTDDKKAAVAERQKLFMKKFIVSLSEEEKCQKYGNNGKSNGMFGNGNKLEKNKNGRWIKSVTRPELVDLVQYENDIIAKASKPSLMKKYNLLREDCKYLNALVCEKYKVKRIDQVKYKVMGYDSWKDYQSANNHRVVSIEQDGVYDAYDMVNVGDTHIYAIETKDGSKLFTHNCTTLNELKQMLVIHSKNSNIKKILHNLFYDILNIEGYLWSWIRNMCKYGDFYLRLYITPEYGVYMVEPISAYNVERIENADPYNKRYVKFQIRPTDTSQAEVVENYEMAHLRLLSDSNFLPYGKCLTSNSYVETEFGVKRINEIKVGDSVWSFNKNSVFELSKVKNVCKSGIKPILKISTRHNEIQCSPEHPILVCSPSRNLAYVQAKSISMSDLVVVSANKHLKTRPVILSKNLLTEENHNGWQKNLALLPNNADEDFSEFLGFMLGDGWLNQNLNRVSFAAGLDAELNKRYTDLLSKYAFKEVKIDPARENSGEQRYVDSKLLAEFLYVNGFQGDATSKRIPEWIYQLDESKQLSFIRGFINADGSVFTDKWNVNRYQIELNNKSLVEDLKALLDRLNIKCSKVSERGYEGMTEICGIPCHRNKSYYIYFYLDGTRRSQEKKYKKLESDQFILVPITKIEEAEEQETFDIQVESESSNFIANGIIVHNSMIESARRVWKQLSLMEDAMLIHRIMRAPERRIFKIDVGTIPPAEVDAYMEKLMNKMQKVPYMDDRTGDYNLRFNLQTMVEDFYLPVRGGDSGTSIDTLSGMEWTGIEDLDYIKHKMMAALKIPKAFLGFEEGLSGKATLASEDVRFARTIQRIQRIVASELQKIAIVHLYSQGYRDEDLVDFELELTNPSTVFEREKVEIWSDKVAVATDMLDVKLFSKDWIYKNVFNMSDEDKQMVNDQVIEDTKQKYRLTSIEEEGNDPAKPVQKIGGDEIEGGGDEGPDLGGAEAGPDEGPKGGEGPGGGAGGPPGGGGEGPLKEETIKPILERRPERDQTGLKDASDFKYRYGEDYDGHLEMNSKPGSEREIRPNPRRTRLGMEEEIGGRPIIDQGTIENLKEFLFKPLEQVEKELLLELQQRSGSLADFLDEKNILEE